MNYNQIKTRNKKHKAKRAYMLKTLSHNNIYAFSGVKTTYILKRFSKNKWAFVSLSDCVTMACGIQKNMHDAILAADCPIHPVLMIKGQKKFIQWLIKINNPKK